MIRGTFSRFVLRVSVGGSQVLILVLFIVRVLSSLFGLLLLSIRWFVVVLFYNF